MFQVRSFHNLMGHSCAKQRRPYLGMFENYEELNKKVNMIEDKIKNVNYCEEEVREVHFTENDKVDHEMIIDSGCPKTLASEKIVHSYVKRHNLDFNELKRKPCAMMFKFGGSIYPSHK